MGKINNVIRISMGYMELFGVSHTNWVDEHAALDRYCELLKCRVLEIWPDAEVKVMSSGHDEGSVLLYDADPDDLKSICDDIQRLKDDLRELQMLWL